MCRKDYDFSERRDLNDLLKICRTKNSCIQCYLRENLDDMNWACISQCRQLSEVFIRKFSDKLDWNLISKYQQLPEDFIREYADKVKWDFISMYQHLSEDFIREYADKVIWCFISKFQHLSEDFICEHADKVKWDFISMYQHLSEDFIREHADKVYWRFISRFQHLPEGLIREYADKVYWREISKYQQLSDGFIKEFEDKVDLDSINNSWHKVDVKEKKAKVVETGLYECHEEYFIAYKSIRRNRYSHYNFQYQYQPNETYETFADYSDNKNSFGFSAWTYDEAKDYCPDLVVTCKIYYEDVARVVHNGSKIRCSKITILN